MDGSAKHRRMLNRLKALSLLAPDAVILTPVADSDVIVAHKNGTDNRSKRCAGWTKVGSRKGRPSASSTEGQRISGLRSAHADATGRARSREDDEDRWWSP